MTAKQLAEKAKADHPDVRYAWADAAVGAFNAACGRFVVVASRLLTGEWVDVPFEVLVNGQPVPRTWTEV